MAGFSGSPPGLSTDPLWAASGAIVYATGDDASSVLAVGSAGYVLTVNCDSTLKWAAGFSGPACSTDNAIPTFHGTGGATFQDTTVTISDSNVLTADAGIVVDNLTVNCCAITATSGFTVDATGDIVFDADGDDITFKAGSDDSTGLAFTNSGGTWTVKAGTSNSDLIFNVNDGGVDTKVMAIDGGDSVVTFGGNSVKSGEIRILEDTSCGANYTAFKVGDMAADVTYTLPTNYAASCGLFLKSTCAGVLSWAAAGGGCVVCDTSPQLGGSLDAQTETILNIGNASNDILATGIRTVNGCATTPSYSFTSATNDGMFLVADDHIGISSGGTHRFSVHGAAVRVTANGTFFVSECANGNSQIGATINQLANDNNILTLKSSDVGACGNLSGVEADTYAVFKKRDGAGGGLHISTLQHGGGPQSFYVEAYAALNRSGQTTGGTGANGVIHFRGYEFDDTGDDSSADALEGGDILFVIAEGGTASVYVTADGGIASNASTSVGLFDSYNDALMLRAMDKVVSPGCMIQTRWDDYVTYNEQALIDSGIFTGRMTNDDGTLIDPHVKERGMWDITQHLKLLNGAAWQLWTELQETKEEISKIGAWTRDSQTSGVVAAACTQEKKGLKGILGNMGSMLKRKKKEE